MLETINGAFPVFERVTGCGADFAPSSTVPKERLLDERLACGVPELIPDNVIDCGLLGTLSEIAAAPG